MLLPRWLKRIALAITVPLLAVTGLEVAMRVMGAGYPTDFLLLRRHGDQQVWVDNPLFGYRFFPHAITRTPPPIVVPALKDPGEFRVVVLGESAAMGEPETAFGPARMLDKMLARQMTGQTVRVINAAMTAINSHVIAEIARELPKMQPDAVILYIGNNEAVGPFGPGTVMGRFNSWHWVTRLNVCLSRLRIVSWLRGVYFRFRQEDRASWRGMEMFINQRVAEDDMRLIQSRMAFQENLSAIIKEAQSAGARVLLSTVAVNLNDQAPLDGSAYEPRQSRERLKRIRDGDQMRFRADSGINQIIRSIAAGNGRLMFADAEAHADYLDLPDQELFVDHVHFTTRGAWELATVWMGALGYENAVPYEKALDLLGWTAVSQLEISEIMIQRFSREPFTSTTDHALKMDRWTRTRSAAIRAMQTWNDASLSGAFDELIESDPDDPYYLQLAYTAAKAGNEADKARGYLDELSRAWPHRIEVRGWQAMELATKPGQRALWPVITEAMPELGMLPADLLAGISESLLQEGHREAAVRAIQEAVQQFPYLRRLRIILASRLAQAGLATEAGKEFLDLLNDDPDSSDFRMEYAAFLISEGKFNEARVLLQALRSGSGDPETRLKWVQFLFLSGEGDSALQELDRILDRHPRSVEALELAGGIHARQGNTEDAIRFFESALKLAPWRETAGWKLAGLYDMNGKAGKALETLKALAPYSTSPQSLEQDIQQLEFRLR